MIPADIGKRLLVSRGASENAWTLVRPADLVAALGWCLSRRQSEKEYVVFAAPELQLEGIQLQVSSQGVESVGRRETLLLDDRADSTCRAQMVEVTSEAVGDVGAGGRPRGEPTPEVELSLGLQVPLQAVEGVVAEIRRQL